MLSLTMILVMVMAQHAPAAPAAARGTEALAIQVTLDRAGFSPGVIDGQMGTNTRRAIDAYQQRHNNAPEPTAEPTIAYTITPEDVNLPYTGEIPADLMKQSELPALSYTSPLEAIAERFHASPQLLKRLNPNATFAAGEQVTVPNVDPFIVPAPRLDAPAKPQRSERGTAGRSNTAKEKPVDQPAKPNVTVTVSRTTSALTVTDDENQVIFYAPVTTGSEKDPLPIGEWKVTGVQYSPEFRYNPELFWDADPSHAKATLKAGPNNPVGVVWIDLSKEHYGIHGTPEPATIGKTTSHGCVRLTNWDALHLAGLVKPGTRVVFTE
jgi:lipoprotein-anchoring transpeptidase ErfK/SrfK